MFQIVNIINISKSSRTSSESGIFMVLAPVLLVGMFTFISFWVDLSNRATKQANIQKIVDFAAIGAAAGKSDGISDDDTKSLAEQLIKENFKNESFNLTNKPINTNIIYRQGSIDIVVRAFGEINNYFSPIFLNAKRKTELWAEATVTIPTIAVVMALDLSSSMCNEQIPNVGETNCPRFLATKQSMKRLVELFNPKKDLLGIHCFNTIVCGGSTNPSKLPAPAVIPVPLQLGINNYNPNSAIEAINNIPLWNYNLINSYYVWTHTAGGLQAAADQFDNLPQSLRDSVRKVIILLTDGNPTHPDASDPRVPIDNAILKADELRRKGITIFAVGFGEIAEEKQDPYQLDQGSKIRGFILKRLTLDPVALSNNDPDFSEFNYQIPSFTQHSNEEGIHKGKFYYVSDKSDDHLGIYDEIKKIIKLRIVK
jgi:Flp pilus assembly protein TadG